MKETKIITDECDDLLETLERLTKLVYEYKKTRNTIDADLFKSLVFKFIREIFNSWI